MNITKFALSNLYNMDNIDTNDREYTNGEITVFWKPKFCTHSTICFSELPDVFNPSSRPWINPNAAETDTIINTVKNCPTKALTYKYNNSIFDKFKEEKKEQKTEIKIIKNGPIVIKGNIDIILPDGTKKTSEERIVLCRCGASSQKPYCNGEHGEIGFTD